MVRSTLMALTTLLFFTGVQWLPLAEASALAFTAPIWVALFSWKVLGEPVARSDKWIAAIGFSGVLLIVRPGTDVFPPPPASILLLALAIVNAAFQLLTRKLTVDSAFTSLFYAPLVGAVVSSALLIIYGLPKTVSPTAMILLAMTGAWPTATHLRKP